MLVSESMCRTMELYVGVCTMGAHSLVACARACVCVPPAVQALLNDPTRARNCAQRPDLAASARPTAMLYAVHRSFCELVNIYPATQLLQHDVLAPTAQRDRKGRWRESVGSLRQPPRLDPAGHPPGRVLGTPLSSVGHPPGRVAGCPRPYPMSGEGERKHSGWGPPGQVAGCPRPYPMSARRRSPRAHRLRGTLLGWG